MKVIILICAVVGVAYAKNCGYTGITGDTVTINPVLETTPGGIVLWDHETYNITSVATYQHPHNRYLQGFRYTSKYDYRTTDTFSQAIETEWGDTLVRTVLVTCSDGSSSDYTFRFPITDVNNNAVWEMTGVDLVDIDLDLDLNMNFVLQPIFGEKEYRATASQSSDSFEPISAGIIVSDADYELRNAQVTVGSSNDMITLFVTRQWTAPYPRPYGYKVDFFVNRNLAVGQYKIILMADDGVSADYTVLYLTVEP